MAGSRTTQFLAPNTYATFYQLAHAFSEEVLAQIVSIQMHAQLLTTLYQRLSAASAGEDVRASEAAASAAQLRDAAQQTLEDVRRCFWPEGNHHTLNESRWFPYDEKAWDAFFGQVNQVLDPHLSEIAAYLHSLQAVNDVAGGAARGGNSQAAWPNAELIPVDALLRLQPILTTGGFEARIFGTPRDASFKM